MADKKKDLNKFLFTTQANILRNVDYLPVSAWGFEDEALDIIKKQKHAAVNKKLSKKQQKTFDNAKKQQLAQKIGAVPQTISEIYKILSNSKLANKMPVRPKVNVVKKVNSDETKENGGPEIDSEVLEILKKKGVGKRPFVRNVTSTDKKNVELDEDGVPFKKARKQKMPLTEADKKKRRELRKENRKKKASQEKSARNEDQKEQKPVAIKNDSDIKEGDEPETNSMSFSKLDFVIKADKPLTKKERSEKLSGRDYASLQKKLEKRSDFIEKIRTKNPEKATNLEDKIKWNTAMKRAEGKKVKDNLELLSKAVKRKEKIKDKRKKKWDERVEKVKQDKEKKQDKRETNIAKRRDEKTKKKLDRARFYLMTAGKNSISFSKLDFVIKADKPLTKKEKGGKLSGRDYASLQKKLEKRNNLIEKIRGENPRKAAKLDEKIKWDTAMKRAQGKKVKDDLVLVSKSLKRKEKVKNRRKKKWDERLEKIKQDKEKKWEKRETNIAKRRGQKAKKKLDLARKKGRII